MKIITLTLSPAFDTHCFVEDFKPYSENLARVTSTDACGKGVNISRVLNTVGVENTAFLLLGDDGADTFKKRLSDDGVSFSEVTVKGKIRENITVHTREKNETRISFEGFECTGEILSEIEKQLGENLTDTVVTFTGRAAPGISASELKGFLLKLKLRGARLVIDSRSFNTVSDLTAVKPWLIKPNEEEISMYSDTEVTDAESALAVAEKLHNADIENVIISLGQRGAVLYCNEGGFYCPAPRIDAVSTVGAGDSSIAGFLVATRLGMSKREALKYAVCYGSAACLTEGTRPPRLHDVNTLLDSFNV